MALTKVSGSILKDPLNLGEVSIGGTLTYQDVTNVDSLGIGTFRAGINVSGGQLDVGSNIKLGNAGVVTCTGLDVNGDADIDGHTELDNVNIAGIVTVSSNGINAGILDLKTGNNIRLRFSSGGTAQFRGDTNPIASFDRGSANSTNVKWSYLGADRGLVSSISNEFRITASGTIPMTFHSNGSERLRIDSNGFLGIDNASPVSSFASARNLVIGTASGNHGMTIMSGTNNSGHIEFSDGTSSDAEKTAGGIRYYHGGASENYMRFNTNDGTERLRISSNGQLGVSHDLSGTSAYNRLMLHNPHDGSCWIQMTSTASGNAANTDGFSIGMNSSNVGHVWLRENAKMMFATNGTSRMEISAEGYISNSAQPMFGGHGFAGAGTQTQSNVPAFKFTTVYVNQGSHFNNSTGVFTCPVAGKYLVLACFAGRADAFAWSGLYVLKNGSTMSDNWFPPAINTTSVFAGSHFTYAPLFSGSVYNCAANDTLVMGYHSGYSAPANASRNSCFIMLVG